MLPYKVCNVIWSILAHPPPTHFVCSYFLFPASSQKELNTLHTWAAFTCVAAANDFNRVEDDGEFTVEDGRTVCPNLDLRLCGVGRIYIVTAGNKEVLHVGVSAPAPAALSN